jgi:hypothetical protein
MDRTIFEMREMKMKCVDFAIGKKKMIEDAIQAVFDWTPMANVEWTPLGVREALICTYEVCTYYILIYFPYLPYLFRASG